MNAYGKISLALIALPLLMAGGCKTGKNNGEVLDNRQSAKVMTDSSAMPAGTPNLWVYKTKGDYRDLVPVEMSAEGSRIEAYPAPADVSEAMRPVELKNGYLLDRKGISPRTVFLKLTFAQYAALKTPLSLNEMMDLVVDRAPFTELCNCGSRYTFPEAEKQVNALIEAGTLRTACKPVK